MKVERKISVRKLLYKISLNSEENTKFSLIPSKMPSMSHFSENYSIRMEGKTLAKMALIAKKILRLHKSDSNIF